MQKILLSFVLCCVMMMIKNVAAQSTTFNGANGNNWSTAGSWSDGIPDANTNAVIDAAVIINSAVTCKDLSLAPGSQKSVTVQSGGDLTVAGNMIISSGIGNVLIVNGGGKVAVGGTFTNAYSVLIDCEGTMTVDGALDNQAGSIFTINCGGSLISNSTVTNNGEFNIRKTFQNDRWHLISLPLASVDSYTYFLDDFLQEWMAGTQSWREITSPTETLVKMKGYSLYRTNASAIYNFQGTPNTGSQSIALTKDEDDTPGADLKGWNLIGNPFPSAIDWSLLDDTYGAIYYWDQNAYKSWNNGAGDGKPDAMSVQGFFIYVPSGGPDNFQIGDAQRIHPQDYTFYKSAQSNDGLIVLEVTSEGASDKVFIQFANASTEGFDYTRDAFKLISSADGLSQIYTYGSEDVQLSIDTRPQTEIIPLGFANNKAGFYSIGLSEIANVESVTLEDTREEVFHNLANGDYSFDWNPGLDNSKRFILHLNSVGIETPTPHQNDIFITALAKEVKIANAANGRVSLFDMAGKLRYSSQIENNDHRFVAPVSPGIYVVVVKTNEGVRTEKMVISE